MIITGIVVGCCFFLICAFFLQGLRKIPAEPPHKGVRTIWGKRQNNKVLNEGWNFFPLYPWWHGVIIVKMTKNNIDFTVKEVRTAQDMAEIQVNVSITWQPNKDNLIEYLNSGGEGVKNIIVDTVSEAIREFAADSEKGPKTWEDAIKMRKEFIEKIVAILGEKENQSQEKIKEPHYGNMSMNIKLDSLGIILNRINITEINPKGELAKAAEMMAKEERDRKAETVELNHIIESIKALMEIGFSKEQALELLQTERRKVLKNISELKLNVSQETRAMIEKIGLEVVSKILGR